VANPGFTGGVSNLKPAAFLAVYIREPGGKWQTLGSIANGVLNVADFFSLDSLGRNKAIGSYNFTAKCQMRQSSIIELELLDSICNGTNDFLFKLSGAVAVSPTLVASAGWVYVAAAQVGCKGKFVADGTPDNIRVIELEWQGSILRRDSNEIALYTPSLVDTHFANDGGTFYDIGTYTLAKDGGNPTNANIRSCGIASITLDNHDSAGSPATISPVQNVKLSFEMLATQDGIRRFLPCTLDINVEYDCMATLNADLLKLGNWSVLNPNIVITMLDGVVFTLDNSEVGIETNFEVSGDMDKPRIIRFSHKGKVLQSSFVTIVR